MNKNTDSTHCGWSLNQTSSIRNAVLWNIIQSGEMKTAF